MHWTLYLLIILSMAASWLSDICDWKTAAVVCACVGLGGWFDIRRIHKPVVNRILGVVLFAALIWLDMLEAEGFQGHFLHLCLDMIWALLGYRGMSHAKMTDRVQVGVLSMVPLICMAYALPATEFIGLLLVYFLVLFWNLAKQALAIPTTGSVAGRMQKAVVMHSLPESVGSRGLLWLLLPILLGTMMFLVVPRTGADANVMGIGPQLGAFPDVSLNKTGKITLDPSLVFRADLPENEGGYYWRVEVQNAFDGVNWRSFYAPQENHRKRMPAESAYSLEFVREWRDHRVPTLVQTVQIEPGEDADPELLRFYADEANAWHRYGWRRGNPLNSIRFWLSEMSPQGEMIVDFWRKRFSVGQIRQEYHARIWPSPNEPAAQRLTAFVQEIVGDAQTDRQKVVRIQNYLKKNYAYTLERPVREGNVVEDFLFLQKRGHCEVFSTVMAVLVHRLDIPVRNVTGFVSSEFRDGMHLVRAAHAHSWVEVYLDGRWEVFDPTPSGAQQVSVNWLLRLDDWFSSYKPEHLYGWIFANWRTICAVFVMLLCCLVLSIAPVRILRRHLMPTDRVWKAAWMDILATCRRRENTRKYACIPEEYWWEREYPEVAPMQAFARKYIAARYGRENAANKGRFATNHAIWREAKAVKKFLLLLLD